MEQRRCSKCNTVKPLDDFHRDKKGKGGLSYRCKKCAKSASIAHYFANHESEKAKRRAAHHANRDRNNARSREYAKTHKEQLSEYARRWRENNKATQKDRDRTKYLRRKVAVLSRCKEYVSENREKTLAYQAEYRRENKAAIEAQKLAWYNARRKSDPSFRILCNLRRRLSHALKGENKSARTIELIGQTPSFVISYLESQFKDGMTWENYGLWEIDHIRPCSSFDLSDTKQQAECFRWSNLQPLWKADNIRKGNKIR